MKVKLRVENPLKINLEITVTTSLERWKKISNILKSSSLDYNIKDFAYDIDDAIRKFESTYIGIENDE